MLIAGVLLTSNTQHQENRLAQRELRTKFGYESDEVINEITEHFDAYHQVLLGAQGLLNISPAIKRPPFAKYVQTLNLDKTYPGIQGVGFSLYIPQASLPSHLAMIRAQGYPSYNIRPPGKRDPYSSIIYLEPFINRNLRAFGYDMFSEPTRQMAMQRACDENGAVLSKKVKLVQETSTDIQSGFLLYLPVYRQQSAIDSISGRRKALVGWVYEPFRMNDFISGFSKDLSPNIRIRIYDEESQLSDDLMYDSLRNAENPDPVFKKVKQVDLYHHTWTVVVESTPAFGEQVIPTGQSSTAVLGILASILLSMIVYHLVHSRKFLEQAIAQRTVELQEHQDRLAESKKQIEYALEGSDIGLWDLYVQTGQLIVNARLAEMLGYSQEELSMVNIETWHKYTHPDDIIKSRLAIEAHIEGKTPFYQCDVRMRHKESRWIWVRHTGKVSERTSNGRPVRVTGTHLDISETHERQLDLRRQEAVLSGTSSALNGLLTAGDYKASVNKALAVLGQSVNVDRTYIFQNHASEETGEMVSSQRFEWCKNPDDAQIDNPDLQDVPYSMIPRWLSTFEANRCIHGPVWSFPEQERPILDEQSILSLVAAPINIDGKLWGFVGFDDCHSERIWTVSEISILTVAASGIGGAIKQNTLSTALDDSRRWLQTMKDSLATGIVVVEKATHTVIDVNPAFLRTVGLEREQVIGTRCSRFMCTSDQPCACRDNHGEVDAYNIPVKCSQGCPCVGSDDMIIHDDIMLQTSSGTNIPMIISAVGMSSGGQEYIIHSMVDISALKKAEEQLRDSMALLNGLFESMSDMVYFKDLNGQYSTYNQAFTKTLSPGLDARGLTAYELFGADSAAEREVTDREVIETRRTVTCEYTTVLADGRTIITENRKSPLITDDGRCIGLVGVARDVTSKQLDDQAMLQNSIQLNDVYDKLYKMEQMHEELVQFIVHDMRSPLTSILGGIDMSKDESCSMDIRNRFMGMAEASAQELITMVSSLLDVYKMDDNKMVLHRTNENLLAVTTSTLESVSVIAIQHSVVMSISGEDIEIPVDTELIRRVIVNLLVNAVKHNDVNGIIEVTVSRQGDMARVSIADNGPGIPEEYREAVFDRFIQIELRKNRKKFSTGLGLTYCRLAVELHGGRIGVDSVLGEGSTFWFELPLTPVN